MAKQKTQRKKKRVAAPLVAPQPTKRELQAKELDNAAKAAEIERLRVETEVKDAESKRVAREAEEKRTRAREDYENSTEGQLRRFGVSFAGPVAGMVAGHKLAQSITKKHNAAILAQKDNLDRLAKEADGALKGRSSGRIPNKSAALKLQAAAKASDKLKLVSRRGPMGLITAGVLVAEAAYTRHLAAGEKDGSIAKDAYAAASQIGVFAATTVISERAIAIATKELPEARSVRAIEEARLVSGAIKKGQLADGGDVRAAAKKSLSDVQRIGRAHKLDDLKAAAAVVNVDISALGSKPSKVKIVEAIRAADPAALAETAGKRGPVRKLLSLGSKVASKLLFPVGVGIAATAGYSKYAEAKEAGSSEANAVANGVVVAVGDYLGIDEKSGKAAGQFIADDWNGRADYSALHEYMKPSANSRAAFLAKGKAGLQTAALAKPAAAGAYLNAAAAAKAGASLSVGSAALTPSKPVASSAQQKPKAGSRVWVEGYNRGSGKIAGYYRANPHR